MIDREALAAAFDKGRQESGRRIAEPFSRFDKFEQAMHVAGIDAILSALDTAGYCIVPKEASDEMRQAAQDAGDEYYLGDGITWDEIPAMYRAMVAKAQEGGAS